MRLSKLEKMTEYAIWKDSSDKERALKGQPLKKFEMAKYLGVTNGTLRNWDNASLVKGGEEERWKDFIDKAYKDAMKTNSNSRDKELYARLMGRYTEKTETKVEIGLSADEIARRNLEAERRTSGYRVEELPEELPLLPPELHKDT